MQVKICIRVDAHAYTRVRLDVCRARVCGCVSRRIDASGLRTQKPDIASRIQSYVTHVALRVCIRSLRIYDTCVYRCICIYACNGSVCARRRNTLRTRTSKQTQSNQFARLIDFPSHDRRCAACAARPKYTHIERQCDAPYKSNPKLSFDYQANSRGRL